MATSNKQVQCYHLIVGTVTFTVEGVPGVHSQDMNAVVTSKDGKMPSAFLGTAQKAIQMQFWQRAKDNVPLPEITDVIVRNIVTLGSFTPEQFHADPPAAKPPAATLSLVPGLDGKEPVAPTVQ